MKLATIVLLAVSMPSLAAASSEEAKKAYEKASDLFRRGEYEWALPEFERAYALSGKRPSAIRGLAQCEWALRRYDRAIHRFREYLATSPPADEQAAIEETIKQIERERDQASVRTAPAPAPPPEWPEEQTARRSSAPPPEWPAEPTQSGASSSGSGGVLSSPLFWIITGAVVVTTVVVIVVVTSSGGDEGENFFGLRTSF